MCSVNQVGYRHHTGALTESLGMGEGPGRRLPRLHVTWATRAVSDPAVSQALPIPAAGEVHSQSCKRLSVESWGPAGGEGGVHSADIAEATLWVSHCRCLGEKDSHALSLRIQRKARQGSGAGPLAERALTWIYDLAPP